jgi:hypothetical protein
MKPIIPLVMRISLPDTEKLIKRIDALEKRIDALKIIPSQKVCRTEFFIDQRVEESLAKHEPGSANGGSAHKATP